MAINMHTHSQETEPGRFYRHSYKPMLLKKQHSGGTTVKMDEAAIVIFVLFVWFGVICLFIKKWGKIRAIEPCQSYFAPEIYELPLKGSGKCPYFVTNVHVHFFLCVIFEHDERTL